MGAVHTHAALRPNISLAEQRVGLERLKLAVEKNREHVFGFEEFDFSRYRNACGTAGCIAGTFPAIWPEVWEWSFTDNGVWPTRAGTIESRDDTAERFAEWFGISPKESDTLFSPADDDLSVFPGAKFLTIYSDLEEVIANLETFIAWKEAALSEAEAETNAAIAHALAESTTPGFRVGGI